MPRLSDNCCDCSGSSEICYFRRYLTYATVIYVVQVFVCFVQIVVDRLTIIEDGKFISVYGYTWKLSCSLTIFHHVHVLLLNYN